ncbi:MAG: RHS repeat domain-containing protein [Aestuariibacter sp.]
MATRRGFTDHEHLDEAELIHMNGRVYDYNVGRFMSVDPVIQSPTNSQSINPYSYIMNNPLSGTDPTGYIANRDGIPDDIMRESGLDKVKRCDPRGGCLAGSTSFGSGSKHTDNGSDKDEEAASNSDTSVVDINSQEDLAATKGTNQSPNISLENETSEQISTFEGRAELYKQMQGKLDEAGIDTVWFGVAGDLNDFFAQQETMLKIGDFFTAGDTHDYLNDLGVDLYDKNKAAFNDLMSGAISIRGQKLERVDLCGMKSNQQMGRL